MHGTIQILHFVPLITMLVLAAGIDLRTRRIPNWLALSVLLTGLINPFINASHVSPSAALVGMGVGFCLPFLLFAIGALGAGDVKLLTGIGAWMGAWGVLYVFLVEAIVGMVIVLIYAGVSGRLSTLFRNSLMIALNMGHVKELGAGHVIATGQSTKTVQQTLPWAVPALISTVIVIWSMIGTR